MTDRSWLALAFLAGLLAGMAWSGAPLAAYAFVAVGALAGRASA